jgi:hypothetical protein
MKELFDNYVENAFGEFKQAEFKFEQFAFNYKKISREIRMQDF